MKFNADTLIDPQVTHSGAQGVGNQDSSTIDCQGFSEAGFSLDLESIGAAGTVDMVIMESDAAASGFVAVTPDVAFTQLVAAGQGLVSIDLGLRKRYLRVRLTVGANSVEAHGQLMLIGPNRSENMTTAWEQLRVAR